MDHKRQSGGDHGGPPRKRPAREDDEAFFDEPDDFIDDEDAPQPPEEGEGVELTEGGRNWKRPDPAPIDPKTDNIGENGSMIK